MIEQNLIYISSTGTFYDNFKGVERTATGATVLMRSAYPHLKEDAIQVRIEALKKNNSYYSIEDAVKAGAAKIKKKKVNKKLPLHNAIEEAIPYLPLRALKQHGQPMKIFYVSDTRECNFIMDPDPEILSYELLNDPKVEDQLRLFYEDGDYLNTLELSFPLYLQALCKAVATHPTLRLREEPPWISWDPTIIAHRHFDVNIVQPGPTPAWDQFLQRLDRPEIFMSWVWTIFDEKDRGRQLLWLAGLGKDGKTTISNAIRKFYGMRHSAILDDSQLDNSRFAVGPLIGKRFVANQECQVPDIFKHPIIKSLTGGDAVSVELKGQQAFTANCYAKLLICSNMYPKVDFTLPSESSRLLFLKVRQRTKFGGEGNFEEQLVSEMGAFLHKCRDARESTKSASEFDIHVPADYRLSMQMDCGSPVFKEMNVFWRTFLEYCPGHEEPLDKIRDCLRQHFMMNKKVSRNIHEVEQAFIRRLESTEPAISGKQMQFETVIDGIPQTFIRDYKLNYIEMM